MDIKKNLRDVFSHQSNEGGEDHPHADDHPLLGVVGRSDLQVVAGEERLHQLVLLVYSACG